MDEKKQFRLQVQIELKNHVAKWSSDLAEEGVRLTLTRLIGLFRARCICNDVTSTNDANEMKTVMFTSVLSQ